MFLSPSEEIVLVGGKGYIVPAIIGVCPAAISIAGIGWVDKNAGPIVQCNYIDGGFVGPILGNDPDLQAHTGKLLFFCPDHT